MDIPTFTAFEAAARAAGFDAVTERVWPPDADVATHRHPFVADAVVVHGEMWLTCGDSTRRLVRGDRFTLARDEPHAERYGADGATYWVARRN